MNSVSSSIVIGIILFLSIQCTTSKSMRPDDKKVSGTVKVIGNEPFTSLALQTAEGKTYVLQCSSNLRTVLLNHQGYQTTVWYDSVKQVLNGKALHVIEADTSFFLH